MEKSKHQLIIDKMKHLVSIWFSGVSTKEHPHSGQELDCFDALYNGVTIMVEVIWTPSPTNFYRDLDIVQNADSKIKIVIVNPEILRNEKLLRQFEKIRIAQIVQGHLMPELLNGKRFLEESEYESWVKEIIQELFIHISIDSNQSKLHLGRIKNLVIIPALSLINRKLSLPNPNEEMKEIPFDINSYRVDGSLEDFFIEEPQLTIDNIDRQLLRDFVEYHYIETIKKPWVEYSRHTSKRDQYNAKVNERIESSLRTGLDSNGINQRQSMYIRDSPDSVPIKEVTELLRLLMETKQNYTLPQIQQIFETHPDEIFFYHQPYNPTLIKVFYEKDNERLSEVYNLLCGILLNILNDREIYEFIATYKNYVNETHRSIPKLRDALNRLLNKEVLNKPSCEFLMP